MNVSIRIAVWLWVRIRSLTLLRRAGGVFAKTRYAASIRDKWALAKNASKLEIGGIAGLNERLFSANTNIFDTITEHNFGCMLLRKFAPPAKVSYEPSGHGPRPVDFWVREDNTTFWFQMKRFSQLARENRRDKIFDVIKKEALRIEANKYFGISFHERFTEAHVESLLDLLAETSAAGFPEAEVTLVVDGGIVARVQFHTPTGVKLKCLTLGYGADDEAVNITGLSDVIPDFSSVMLWSPISTRGDRTNEEAFFGRADHRVSAGS